MTENENIGNIIGPRESGAVAERYNAAIDRAAAKLKQTLSEQRSRMTLGQGFDFLDDARKGFEAIERSLKSDQLLTAREQDALAKKCRREVEELERLAMPRMPE